MERVHQLVPFFNKGKLTFSSVSKLRQEYHEQNYLFQLQPEWVKSHFEKQAAVLTESLLRNSNQVVLILPDEVRYPEKREGDLIVLKPSFPSHKITLGCKANQSIETELSQRLLEWERSPDRALSISAHLYRYALSAHMIYTLLPTGNPVTYLAEEGEEIPSIILGGQPFLPQWMVFDGQERLMKPSPGEAETAIASMQSYLRILQMAVTLAPFMIADEEYQRKRYGILGQLVNQGRALAWYQTIKIIDGIKQRANTRTLDRGFSLSLPYFDDQKLSLENYSFVVIPSGWIMFVPAFVVLAAREQQVKLSQDTGLNYSTRRHLLSELRELEQAFSLATHP